MSEPILPRSTPTTQEAADALDDALDRLLEHTQRYMELTTKSNEAFANGFHSLSRARMHLGSAGWNALGGDGWDGRLRAQIGCKIEADDGGKVYIRLARRSVAQDSNEASADGETDVGSESTQRTVGLRRRTGKRDAMEEPQKIGARSASVAQPQDSAEAEKVDKCDAKKASAVEERHEPASKKRAKQEPDPLYQFAALPPASLRSAQASFRTALDHLLGSVEGSVDASMDTGKGTPSVMQLSQSLKQFEKDIKFDISSNAAAD
ncbi:hypothetical protein IE81DRAFT_364154 [Ceraceosorus guamensis]|uniref:Vacuolar ATPase assembly protein VMA22 n=1 Tax=Ceraceosorus guamensis TaxID=1522189 RepID=A0A316WCB8_9BASI|nr:hypothetical protein IE81DRAFT_364154 [Ceraceosorus guamensis]PWN45523.1 hypothetical protein IE81DRAFT_364154 [Ceraceosorus guamensis]